MAQIANLTVKKFDGTTDIVYVAKTGAAGNGQPAVWRADSVQPIPAHCPTFTLQASSNANGTTRIMKWEFDLPIIDSSSGSPVVVGHQKGNGTIPVLQNADWNQVKEGIAQQLNLMAAALIRTSLLEGYAPRS